MPAAEFLEPLRSYLGQASPDYKERIMPEIEDARAAKRLAGAQYSDRFYGQYDRDVRNWSLEQPDQAFLNLITKGHLSQRALWSNQHVRQVAQQALIDAALDEYTTAPNRRRFWITLAWDAGVTMEREPQLDLVAVRNIAQHHLRRAGLDGFGIVEFDVWKNLTGEGGRRIVGHVHFLGWPTDPDSFNWRKVEAELCAKRSLPNSIGAKSVVIEPVRGTAHDIAHLAMYMTKAPSAAKNMVPGKTKPKLRPAALPQGSAARLVETQSQVEAGDVMFAIGEGTSLSRKVHRAIRIAMRPNRARTPAPTAEAVLQHWPRIRLLNGSKKFRDPVIVTRANQRMLDN